MKLCKVASDLIILQVTSDDPDTAFVVSWSRPGSKEANVHACMWMYIRNILHWCCCITGQSDSSRFRIQGVIYSALFSWELPRASRFSKITVALSCEQGEQDIPIIIVYL